MGFALFMARKMSLKAKVNDYNLKLMQLTNLETKLANQQANIQQGANMVGTLTNLAPMIGAMFGPAGMLAGGVAGKVVGGISDAAMRGQQQALAHKQKMIDTEKQRLTTLIQQASAELQSVEQAEGNAIKSSTPKYVG